MILTFQNLESVRTDLVFRFCSRNQVGCAILKFSAPTLRFLSRSRFIFHLSVENMKSACSNISIRHEHQDTSREYTVQTSWPNTTTKQAVVVGNSQYKLQLFRLYRKYYVSAFPHNKHHNKVSTVIPSRSLHFQPRKQKHKKATQPVLMQPENRSRTNQSSPVQFQVDRVGFQFYKLGSCLIWLGFRFQGMIHSVSGYS